MTALHRLQRPPTPENIDMTTQTLSSVALHVVGQYNEAGKTLVGAYRAGSRRLLNDVAVRFAPAQTMTDFLAARLEADTDRVIAIMDRIAAANATGIETVANRLAQIESPMATSLIETITKLNLPMANVSAQIADGVAAGARQIEARVQGEAMPAPVKAKARPARKARRGVRKAS
jgi:hypothetical protein